MPGSGLLEPFLGALQASLSVLLTIFYGVVATQFNLINDKTAKQISQLCVKLFLPALLITNIGSQLSLETFGRYVPIFSQHPLTYFGRPWGVQFANSRCCK